MKICAICGTENSDEARSCQQCGFSLEVGETLGNIQFPTIEIPQISTDSLWADIPSVDMPTEVPEMSPVSMPEGQAGPMEVVEIGDGVIDAVVYSDVDVGVDGGVDTEAESDTEDAEDAEDDELARDHLRRGLEALRAGLTEQAIWEFEQARDLAEDDETIRWARSQLRHLLSSPRDTAPPQTQAVVVRTTTGPARPPTSFSWTNLVDVGPDASARWQTVLRFSIFVALATGVFTGCSALFCLGFILTPVVAFLAGRWVASQQNRDGGEVPAGVLPAIAVGAIVGLGGWIGQMVGYPSWYSSVSSSSTSADLETVTSVLSCLSTGWYLPTGMVLGVLGWRTGQRGV